jgi:hypothetical protein
MYNQLKGNAFCLFPENNKFQEIKTFVQYINTIKRLQGEVGDRQVSIERHKKVYRPVEKVLKIKL